MPDLQVGPSLEDFTSKLDSIVATLQPAYRASMDAQSEVFQPVYEGAAQADMETFYKQYTDHIENLIYYYGLAKDYLNFVAEEIETVDAQMASMID